MKTLFLTGGNEGIGYFMVKHWIQQGNSAAVLDLNCDNIEKLKQSYPDSVISFRGDVGVTEVVKKAVQETFDRFGGIQFAVHNACLCLFKSFKEHNPEDFKKVMHVNLDGAIHMTQAVLPVMTYQGKGKVFFTSSAVGVTGFVNISAYACSKGALESLAKCLNIEYMGSGITFHLLHPPLTHTKSSDPLPVPAKFKASPEKVGKGLIRHIDSKKFIITPSSGVSASLKLSYLFPLPMGRMLVKMTKKANESSQ
jgi:NAD(P)-dependent dehydrogenase (short-subunit alcohol dehydrogenase family)